MSAEPLGFAGHSIAGLDLGRRIIGIRGDFRPAIGEHFAAAPQAVLEVGLGLRQVGELPPISVMVHE
jgi:hypothetical protein